MLELLKFTIPLMSPKNYAEMLAKLSSFVFWETWIATLFLRDITPIGELLSKVENYGAIGKIFAANPGFETWNASGFVFALAIAGITYSVKFHDKISDLFGIRHRFDQMHILQPLAELVGVTLNSQQLQKLSDQRDSLMRNVFYRYASSRASNTLVDPHDIQHALIAWSGYWILIETAALFLIYGVVSWLCGDIMLLGIFAFISMLCIVTSIIRYLSLERYSRPQIEAIASDCQAASHVRAVFNAL